MNSSSETAINNASSHNPRVVSKKLKQPRVINIKQKSQNIPSVNNFFPYRSLPKHAYNYNSVHFHKTNKQPLVLIKFTTNSNKSICKNPFKEASISKTKCFLTWPASKKCVTEGSQATTSHVGPSKHDRRQSVQRDEDNHQCQFQFYRNC